MKFLNKMERKFGRYAIRNLTWYIIVTYIIGFSLELLAPQILGYITLEPALIMIRETLELGEEDMLLPFSAEKGIGKEELIRLLNGAMEQA